MNKILVLLLCFVSYNIHSEDSDMFVKRHTFHLTNMYAENKDGVLYEVEEHGTAILVSAAGYGNFLVTANHCVKRGEITTLTNDKEKFNAKVVYRDAELDIAILKCKEIEDKKNVPELFSSELKVGDILNFCHYPRGAGPVMSQGTLLMIEARSINYYASADKFFSGSSGCPVFNDKNKVVGICLAGLAFNGQMQEGRCFFLPSKRIFQAISELKPFFSKL